LGSWLVEQKLLRKELGAWVLPLENEEINQKMVRNVIGVVKYLVAVTFFRISKYATPVASIPIPGGRSLRPMKNRGSFDKVVDQTPYFY